MQLAERIYYNHTPTALEDELVFLLLSKNDSEVIEDWDGSQHILIYHPYTNQAEGRLYKINVNDSLPEFVIWENDVPLGLVQALEELGDITMKRIITNVVRRIYETVNPTYYHTNGIYGKVKWRFGSG